MNIDIDYISNLSTNNEGVDVEFKETTGQLYRGMETLSIMNKECEKAGLFRPQIIDNGFMVKVVLFRPKNENKTPVEHQLNTSKISAEDKHDVISASLVRLIRAIGENWYSAKELRELMGFKSKSSFIKNYLTPAQNIGIIQLEDSANPQSPNQRYGLTEKGKQFFKAKKS